jgi:hypothetical protein
MGCVHDSQKNRTHSLLAFPLQKGLIPGYKTTVWKKVKNLREIDHRRILTGDEKDGKIWEKG